MERLKDLRGLLRATQKTLARLEKRPWKDTEEIERERAILEAIRREIQRLERQLVYSDFDL
ncbi:hypothetical protein ACFL0Q_07465 [Thermodesulfobacteriota bacterium]